MPIRLLSLLLAALLLTTTPEATAEPVADAIPGLHLSVERQPDGSRRALVQNPLAGPVMQVVDHFQAGGTDAALLERANVVRVLHADGSELLSLPFRMAAPDGQWLGEAL